MIETKSGAAKPSQQKLLRDTDPDSSPKTNVQRVIFKSSRKDYVLQEKPKPLEDPTTTIKNSSYKNNLDKNAHSFNPWSGLNLNESDDTDRVEEKHCQETKERQSDET